MVAVVKPEKIQIVVTGGTIDKVYDKIEGQLVFQKTMVESLLKQARCRVPVGLTKVMLKDSLHMSDGDRELVLAAVRKLRAQRVIVTHGTDTMAETARVLGRAGLKKTVVLFGAMIPYAFGNSDAVFNFGTAVAAVQTLPPGVYLTMNGRVFAWDNVRKNRKDGVFETVKDETLQEWLEDQEDIESALRALKEGGKPIPWAKLKKQLGLK